MNSSDLSVGYSDMFIRWILVWWCDMLPNWHVFVMFGHFSIFESILSSWVSITWYSWFLYKCFTSLGYMSITQWWHIVCNHDHCNSSLWHLFVIYVVCETYTQSIIVPLSCVGLWIICLKPCNLNIVQQ